MINSYLNTILYLSTEYYVVYTLTNLIPAASALKLFLSHDWNGVHGHTIYSKALGVGGTSFLSAQSSRPTDRSKIRIRSLLPPLVLKRKWHFEYCTVNWINTVAVCYSSSHCWVARPDHCLGNTLDYVDHYWSSALTVDTVELDSLLLVSHHFEILYIL